MHGPDGADHPDADVFSTVEPANEQNLDRLQREVSGALDPGAASALAGGRRLPGLRSRRLVACPGRRHCAEPTPVRLVWLVGLVALGLALGIAWYLAPLRPNVLALQFAFTPRAFGEVIHFWSAEQLLRFRAHLPADGALLLSYGLFGYLLASRTKLFGPLSPGGRRWATWALPLAAAFDAAENALHLWLTEAPRFGVPLSYALAAGCASLKWLAIVGFAATVVVALTKAERGAE